MTVYAKGFHHPAVRRVGFQTVVHRCFVKVKVAEVFPYQRNAGAGPFGDSDDEENDYDHWSVYFKSFGRTLVQIAGRDFFVLSESDLALINGTPYWVDDKQVIPNPAVPYFLTSNVRRLDEH
ncbi:hypothetical protein RvY_00351 [Ramazzottius varieornatus]|uniref:Uncharacterized protein n=1 Tax=Ramazzottius varieornatus TaxID=947166 RepID=A0A1D1UCH7_RAMVA|nr:hypothetical protein RvY_00351 [Ramazzottius varieornatus]